MSPDDDRQLARREPEPRRVEVTADDVMPPGVYVEQVDGMVEIWYDESEGLVTPEQWQEFTARSTLGGCDEAE